MASVQRAHWTFVVLQCLLLTLMLCRKAVVVADRNKNYHMSTLCVREGFHLLYKKIDGAVLRSESEGNLDCIITFQTDSILQKFMLHFESLALDCYDHLYIFDGAHAFGHHKADLSCRDTRSAVGIIFTQSNYVTLKYVTDGKRPEGNGFQLIITAYKDSPIGCRDFLCLNGFCISEDLKCDEVNHCTDNSDETNHALCRDDSHAGRILGIGVTVFVASVITVILVCFICVVSIAICLCRRHQQQQQQLQLQRPSSGTQTPTSAGACNMNAGPLGQGAGQGPGYISMTHPTAPYPTNQQPRYNQLGEKPPPYPGNMYTSVGYHVPHQNVYYPTK